MRRRLEWKEPEPWGDSKSWTLWLGKEHVGTVVRERGMLLLYRHRTLFGRFLTKSKLEAKLLEHLEVCNGR